MAALARTSGVGVNVGNGVFVGGPGVGVCDGAIVAVGVGSPPPEEHAASAAAANHGAPARRSRRIARS
jgi:hypothetical protein